MLHVSGRPLPAILKVQLQILEGTPWVGFDGEMVMRLALDQIVGEPALGEQGVGRHILALNLDGFQQRDGHLDLVGALDLRAAFYGQGTDFFWV